jgi:sec-independent protein translocase protein TatC
MSEEKNNEHPLLEHLSELRKRIIKSLVAVLVFLGISGYFSDFILNEIVLAPALANNLELLNVKVFGQPIFYFKIVVASGIILALPFILNQVWGFVKPALYDDEVKWVRAISVYSTLFFFAGIVFSYYVIVPGMLKFASTFGSDLIENRIDINNFLSFLILIITSMGLLFELPVVTYLLSKAGILSPKTMLKYWKHAIILILILAAVITPTPDPISQLIFATPLFILYLISIAISKIAYKPEL